jgi:crotonobetainyl-CoA:carnitine CoA-transferase CaiB-like acyl-CoA transferase
MANPSDPDPSSFAALQKLWTDLELPGEALAQIDLPSAAAALPSAFHVGIAAQTSIGAAALAAESIYHQRTGRHQRISVDRPAAELECTALFRLDGTRPRSWEMFSGLYETGDGYVRIHANFDHHRDGILELLGLPDASLASREAVADALSGWTAQAFEDAAADAGLVVAMVRSFEEWDRHPQALASRDLPLLSIRRLDDAPPLPLAAADADTRPLTGVRVLDLTRILAGPICGRTLAAYGAEVLLINSPELPNIPSIIDTSRGKRSAHIDLKSPAGAATLRDLLGDAHFFVQGYRPGSLGALGFAPHELARIRPGIVSVSLSAYGTEGPWASRRGFDSLVQTATGFNHAEAAAAGAASPRSLPVPILDYASGFLMAFGAQAALLKQQQQGGSWAVEVSLLQTANWLRAMGRSSDGFDVKPPELGDYLAPFPCAEGTLLGMPHGARFSATPARWDQPSALPGAHQPRWRR